MIDGEENLGEPRLELDNVGVIVELELPEGDEGEEEDGEEGEQGVGHALTPNRAELVMRMLMRMLMRMMRMWKRVTRTEENQNKSRIFSPRLRKGLVGR